VSISAFPVGKTVRISGAFVDVNGAAVDPSTVTLAYKAPGGSRTTKTYAAGDVVKDSTGNYHYDLPLTVAGRWKYRWESTGPTTTQTDNEIRVIPTDVD
jgi:hypothetical protein